MTPALKAMIRLAHNWGGELRVTDKLPRGIFLAPFNTTTGINWRRKIVYAKPHADLGELIHELGHVFACRVDPDGDIEEWDWFGWEIATARWAGCMRQWSQSMHDYIVDDDESGDWGGLSPSGKRRVASERVYAAQQDGLVDRKGKPLSVR